MYTVEIDAKGKIVGRLASQVATVLQGKDKPSYRPDRMADVTVVIKNAEHMKVTGKKMKMKMYYHFSGYPGGLKKRRLEEVMAKSPADVLMMAVRRMLPKNKTRDRLLKRLVIEPAS